MELYAKICPVVAVRNYPMIINVVLNQSNFQLKRKKIFFIFP